MLQLVNFAKMCTVFVLVLLTHLEYLLLGLVGSRFFYHDALVNISNRRIQFFYFLHQHFVGLALVFLLLPQLVDFVFEHIVARECLIIRSDSLLQVYL